MKILGLDPGRSTGWGVISVDPDTKKMSVLNYGVTKDQTLVDILPDMKTVDRIVFETFEIRPGEARKGAFDWDPMETPQVIGALKCLSRLYDLPIFPQSPSVKPVGYGFLNLKYVKGKQGMHSTDGLVHAAFYAVRNNLAVPIAP